MMNSLKPRKVHPPIRSAALLKYLEAQIKLREITTPDDGHYLHAFGRWPDDLYQHMRKMGFMWDRTEKWWRLRKGLSEPIWYMFDE